VIDTSVDLSKCMRIAHITKEGAVVYESKKDLDNTQILPIEEEEVNGNSFLVIGGERFKIDGGASILINRNMPPELLLRN